MRQPLIQKVLSTIQKHNLKALIMGGQACVLYGAAEISKDLDLVFLIEKENIDRLNTALNELEAVCIAVPPFEISYLEKGHAVHFRCKKKALDGLRIDIMSKMRGVDPFDELWKRRTTLEFADATKHELLSIEDLVKAKKTQRTKDWPMIQRLLESHYARFKSNPSDANINFWLQELRTPEILIDIAKENPEKCHQIQKTRTLLSLAIKGKLSQLRVALRDEEEREKELDRTYWKPLIKELEHLRHVSRRS